MEFLLTEMIHVLCRIQDTVVSTMAGGKWALPGGNSQPPQVQPERRPA